MDCWGPLIELTPSGSSAARATKVPCVREAILSILWAFVKPSVGMPKAVEAEGGEVRAAEVAARTARVASEARSR